MNVTGEAMSEAPKPKISQLLEMSNIIHKKIYKKKNKNYIIILHWEKGKIISMIWWKDSWVNVWGTLGQQGHRGQQGHVIHSKPFGFL